MYTILYVSRLVYLAHMNLKTLVAACLLVAVAISMSTDFSSQTIAYAPFQASEPVAIPTKVVSSETKKFLFDFMRKNKGNVCGVAAPNVGVYLQYMVMDLDGVLREMVNPTYAVEPELTTKKYSQIEETSLMCPSQSAKVDRYVSITAVFYSSAYGFLTQHTETLTSRHAVCYQHFVDVFSGHWPCQTEKNQLSPISLQ